MPRILLIEDHPDLRMATRLWLTSCGHDVTAAATAAEAMHQIGVGCFDIIVSDIGLPDMNGVELLRLMRARCDTPAVAFSGYDELRDKYPDFNTLFAAHIAKPVDPDKMESIIRRVLAG